MTEDGVWSEDGRPSAHFHEEVRKAIADSIDIDWDVVEKIRQPVLDYLKRCETADMRVPLWFDGCAISDPKGLTLVFSLAEDGDTEDIFTSETYVLSDAIFRQCSDDIRELYDVVLALERTVECVRAMFAEKFGISCTAEAVRELLGKGLSG